MKTLQIRPSHRRALTALTRWRVQNPKAANALAQLLQEVWSAMFGG